MTTKKLTLYWSLAVSIAIALFWTAWQQITGKAVPVITSIGMTPDWIYVLPFGISHWWDILFGFILTNILFTLLLVSNKKFLKGSVPLLSAYAAIFLLFSGLLLLLGLTNNLTIPMLLLGTAFCSSFSLGILYNETCLDSS